MDEIPGQLDRIQLQDSNSAAIRRRPLPRSQTDVLRSHSQATSTQTQQEPSKTGQISQPNVPRSVLQTPYAVPDPCPYAFLAPAAHAALVALANECSPPTAERMRRLAAILHLATNKLSLQRLDNLLHWPALEMETTTLLNTFVSTDYRLNDMPHYRLAMPTIRAGLHMRIESKPSVLTCHVQSDATTRRMTDGVDEMFARAVLRLMVALYDTTGGADGQISSTELEFSVRWLSEPLLVSLEDQVWILYHVLLLRQLVARKHWWNNMGKMEKLESRFKRSRLYWRYA